MSESIWRRRRQSARPPWRGVGRRSKPSSASWPARFHHPPNLEANPLNDMKTIRQLIAVSFIAWCASANAAENANRFNILFCFADDWGRYASAYAAVDGRPGPNDVVRSRRIETPLRTSRAGASILPATYFPRPVSTSTEYPSCARYSARSVRCCPVDATSG